MDDDLYASANDGIYGAAGASETVDASQLAAQLATAQAELAHARRAAEAWVSVFRDDPSCAGGEPLPARVSDALLSLRGAERSAAESARDAARRAAALAARCDALEAEAAELRAALAASPPPPLPGSADALIVDPSTASELRRLTSALDAAHEALKAKDEEIGALAFSKESKQGRMLMARVRTLIKENEELGAAVSEGRLAGLEAGMGVLKAAHAAVKREAAELAAVAAAVAEENEVLQLLAFPRGGGDGGVGAKRGREEDGADEGGAEQREGKEGEDALTAAA